jgi:hypothetical protein
MKRTTVTFCWTYCGMDMAAEADVTYTPGRPGVLYGPPEHCYPADPLELVNVLSCTLREVNSTKVCEDMDPAKLPEDLLLKIEETLAYNEDYDPHDDYVYDEDRESDDD